MHLSEGTVKVHVSAILKRLNVRTRAKAVAAVAPPLLARARADQVALLYRSWHRTTVSMALGAALLCVVLWERESATVMALWFAAILANQAWRGALARAYRRAPPDVSDAKRWGLYWAAGSTVAGALW